MEKSTLTSVGAVATASLAALCCAGPLGLAVLGTAGLGLHIFEPYRPYLIAMTAILLGIGFYLTYRKRAETCGDDGVCIAPTSLRMRKVGLWAATGFTGLMLAVPYLPMGSISASMGDTAQATTILVLEGMT